MSQIQFENNAEGVQCMEYREDSVTKKNDGGLKSIKKQHKIVWVYPSSNRVHCPV